MSVSEQLKMPWARYTGIEAARAIGCAPATVRRRLIAAGIMASDQSITHIYIDGATLDRIRHRIVPIAAPAADPAALGQRALGCSSLNLAAGSDGSVAVFGGER